MELENFIKENQKLWDECKYVKNEQIRYELVDVLSTIIRLKRVEWFKNYKPEKDKGFMFSDDPNIHKIVDNLNHKRHSGGSMASAFRGAEAFFKNQ